MLQSKNKKNWKTLKRKSRLNAISKDPRRIARRFVPASIIKQVKERSHGKCEFVDLGLRCQNQAERTPHHVVERSQGGKHTLENLKDSCWEHNQFAKTHKKYCEKIGWSKPYVGYVPEK